MRYLRIMILGTLIIPMISGTAQAGLTWHQWKVKHPIGCQFFLREDNLTPVTRHAIGTYLDHAAWLRQVRLQNFREYRASLIPVSVSSSSPVPISDYGTGEVQSLITSLAPKYGVDVNTALRIADCESGFDPNAYNDGGCGGSGCGGVYQQMLSAWPSRAATYGFAGASVYDAVANISVSFAMVQHDGCWCQWQCT